MLKIIAFALLLTLVPVVSAGARKLTADLVVINAKIRTMETARPRAEAVAVTGNKIVAVGTSAEIMRLTGPDTKTIDAAGRLVIPGFNDAHVHFMGMGNQFSSIDLRGAKTPGELIEQVKFYVNFLPAGRWILGGGWDHEKWSPAALPTRELLDAATPDNPVFIYHADAKSVIVNGAALKLAGIAAQDSRETDASDGVVRDAQGEPTGVLTGAALRQVKSLTPADQTTNKSAVLETASNYAAFFGVTSVQDMSVDDNTDVYRELERAGKLKTRVYDCVNLADAAGLTIPPDRRATGERMVRGGCLKSFSDGEEDSRPALEKEIRAADRAGLQVMIHGIGPRANGIVLASFERAARANGPRDRRFRVEHAHNFHPTDLARFGRSKIIASLQPALFAAGGQSTEPLRSLLKTKALFAFGSDSSIIPVNPLEGIYAAVNNADSKEAISVEEAVRFYTLGSAYAEFQERVKGSIAVGKLADLVMLSDDIFTIKIEEIRRARVLLTIVDGRIVFAHPGAPASRPAMSSKDDKRP